MLACKFKRTLCKQDQAPMWKTKFSSQTILRPLRTKTSVWKHKIMLLLFYHQSCWKVENFTPSCCPTHPMLILHNTKLFRLISLQLHQRYQKWNPDFYFPLYCCTFSGYFKRYNYTLPSAIHQIEQRKQERISIRNYSTKAMLVINPRLI